MIRQDENRRPVHSWQKRLPETVSAAPHAEFPADFGHYHLYVSFACPWASRTIIYRKLKGLKRAISLSVVDPYMGENGWQFSADRGCIPDTIFNARYVYGPALRG